MTNTHQCIGDATRAFESFLDIWIKVLPHASVTHCEAGNADNHTFELSPRTNCSSKRARSRSNPFLLDRHRLLRLESVVCAGLQNSAGYSK